MKRNPLKIRIGKPPSISMGKKPSKAIAAALGIHHTTTVSPAMLGKLVNHPDKKIASQAKKLLGQI